ncbi:MAG: hypothetical protein P4N59_05100 [Negativicutes bacterium]|nr:hypothetical protein [Negativicutes bacterium]
MLRFLFLSSQVGQALRRLRSKARCFGDVRLQGRSLTTRKAGEDHAKTT